MVGNNWKMRSMLFQGCKKKLVKYDKVCNQDLSKEGEKNPTAPDFGQF